MTNPAKNLGVAHEKFIMHSLPLIRPIIIIIILTIIDFQVSESESFIVFVLFLKNENVAALEW